MVWQASPNAVVTSLFTSSGAVSVPANGQYMPINVVDISNFASYDMSMLAIDGSQNTAGHALTFLVRVQWYDDPTSGIPVFQEEWNPWVLHDQGTTPGVIATGPMHGRYMSVTIINNSSHAFNLNFFNLFGSARTIPLSDWRQNHGNHVLDSARTLIPTAAGTGFENSLADTGGNVTLALSTGYYMPLALYAGPVLLTLQIVANPGSINALPQIVDLGTNQENSGSITTNVGPLEAYSIATTGFQPVTAILPRSACALILTTNAGTAAQIGFKAVAQQGP